MRLIDADALLEDMKTFKDNCESIGIIPNWEHANRIIKEQPTAFSVEAVVAELEKLADYNGNAYLDCADVLEIVQGKE